MIILDGADYVTFTGTDSSLRLALPVLCYAYLMWYGLKEHVRQ